MAKQFYEINADLVERIKSVMNRANERANAFAARLNYNPSNLSGILNGKRPVPASLIDAICNTYNVERKWLITGCEEQNQQETSCGVPYYNVDFTLGFDIMENDQTRIPDGHMDLPQYNSCTCLVHARGDSMMPTISPGDIIAIKKIEDFRYLISGEIYAIVTKNGLRTIKRVNDKGESIQLIPDNKDYEEQSIPKAELLHVFVVKGCLKAY
jgi:transcriptional regulator with XRE-family HTH domain